VGPVHIDFDDVEYIMVELWCNCCCVTTENIGTVLEIGRWDISKPSDCQTLGFLGVKPLRLFDKATSLAGDGGNSISADIQHRIEASCPMPARCKGMIYKFLKVRKFGWILDWTGSGTLGWTES